MLNNIEEAMLEMVGAEKSHIVENLKYNIQLLFTVNQADAGSIALKTAATQAIYGLQIDNPSKFLDPVQ